MAEKKSTTSKQTTQSTKQTTKKSGNAWGLNKISLYVIVAVAIIYLISMILSLAGVSLKVVVALQNLATAIMICITAVLAWRYVSKKPTVWKVLYFVSLLVVIAGVIVPLIK